MRDEIAEIIRVNAIGGKDGHVLNSPAVADAIIAALPGLVNTLDMPERRNGYWGHKLGYQVAHTNGDLFRVRLHGRVVCKDIRGFNRAINWANNHHTAKILSALGLSPSHEQREDSQDG